MEISNRFSEDLQYIYETVFRRAQVTRTFEGKCGPIIGISGIYGGWLKDGLEKYMKTNHVTGILSRYDDFTEGLESYLLKIDKDVRDYPQSIIVAYSAAGLSSLLWAKRYNSWNKFKRMVTLGTPFRGVRTPAFLTASKQTFKDIDPSSNLIKEVLQIQPPEGKVISIFAEVDEHTIVPRGLKLNWPSVVVGAKSHGDLQNHHKWIANILDAELGISRQDDKIASCI